jgi:hypothetical protein
MQTETRYAITSLVPNAIEILQALRLHWGIENGFQSGCCLHGRRIGNLVAQCCSQFRIAAALRFELKIIEIREYA